MHYYRLRRTGTTNLARKYFFNEHVFSELGHKEAWLLGIIWSDGSINGNRIHISSADYDLLETCQDILGGHNCIHKCKGQNAFYLSFRSCSISKRLRRLGLHERKSLDIDWPVNFDDGLASHFIRGVFDGDGCIYVKAQGSRGAKRIKAEIVSASPAFANAISLKLRQLGIDNKLYKAKNNGKNTAFIYKVSVIRIASCKLLYEVLYLGKNNLAYLKRKKDKFKQVYDYQPPSVGCPVGTIRKKIYDGLESKIISDYLNVSKSLKKTGVKFNISETTVLAVLQRSGVARFSGRNQYDRLSEETKDKIIEKRKQGVTFKEMEKEFNLGRNTIRRVLRQQSCNFAGR